MVSLSIDPPPQRPGQSQGGGRRVAALAVAFVVATAGAFLLGRYTARRDGAPAREAAQERPAATPAPAGATPTAAAPAPAAPAVPAAGAQAAPPAASATTAPADGAAPIPPATSAAPAAVAGPRRLAVTLNGALEDTITGALPREERAAGGQLTQVVNRLLVWELHVARDGRRGDRLEVLYSLPAPAAAGLPASGEPVVEAVRYASQKLGRTVAAYRFQGPSSKWPRYYRPDGAELEERLEGAPIKDYDQVTSLLRDGRRHKGVDFRTPSGTPVFATFDGVIERRNWNFAGNGNCLDVRDPASGRHAIFLHLEVLPKDMVPGRRVKKGEQIALSGNSGHSTAPHLHYQLEAPDGRILDPYTIHRTTRPVLDAAHRPAFDARRGELDALLAAAGAAPPARTAPAAQ